MLSILILSLMTFDPAATERALQHSEGRLGALQQLFTLNLTDLEELLEPHL